jgi:hypothetical protein
VEQQHMRRAGTYLLGFGFGLLLAQEVFSASGTLGTVLFLASGLCAGAGLRSLYHAELAERNKDENC